MRAGALVAAITLLAAGCNGNNNKQNSLHPDGPAAHKILNLFTPFFWIAVVIGIGVLVATIILPLRFRRREGNENPKQVHGNSTLEITWTIIPVLILAVMAIFTVPTIFQLAKTPKGPNVIHVDVMAHQWWWEYKYPKENIYTANELHIPINRPVVLSMTSDNVIHDFWVPELSGKKDVVPGQTNVEVIQAEKPGTYLGQCAEYCGLSHADMRLRVIAQTQADYDTWVQTQQAPPSAADLAEFKKLGTEYSCTTCHMFQGVSKAEVGPNLTHLADREIFAGGKYDLTFDNLWKWVLNAPSRKPNQCPRLPQPDPCKVGMPSMEKTFGMSAGQAQDIAHFLLTLH
ncbi:MAG TPA: cytochrome c oxidase subunit II [Acidimicrobiia bacterium]|jgi:cytochrome c oxidase subunit 2|nr:cytochrome c oxidase subunit II [Acidimicrobiia bacterium]